MRSYLGLDRPAQRVDQRVHPLSHQILMSVYIRSKPSYGNPIFYVKGPNLLNGILLIESSASHLKSLKVLL